MTAPTRNCLDFLKLSEREHCAAIDAAVSASEIRTAKLRGVLTSHAIIPNHTLVLVDTFVQ